MLHRQCNKIPERETTKKTIDKTCHKLYNYTTT